MRQVRWESWKVRRRSRLGYGEALGSSNAALNSNRETSSCVCCYKRGERNSRKGIIAVKWASILGKWSDHKSKYAKWYLDKYTILNDRKCSKKRSLWVVMGAGFLDEHTNWPELRSWTSNNITCSSNSRLQSFAICKFFRTLRGSCSPVASAHSIWIHSIRALPLPWTIG